MRHISPEADALAQILKAVACEEAALGSLANAEARKIQTILKRLERSGANTLIEAQSQDFQKSFVSVLRAAVNMQVILQSKAQALLEYMGLQSYMPLIALPPQGKHWLVSCGQGLVTNNKDDFFSGRANLRKTEVYTEDDSIKKGNIFYDSSKEKLRIKMEAMPGTINVKWPSLLESSATLQDPQIIEISGRAFVKKRYKKQSKTDTALFNLTLWDGGQGITNTHKFRMIIKSERYLDLNHDSGSVDLTGILKRQ